MDAGVKKHLNVHIYLVTIAYQYYNQLISRTDLSPIPVRSVAKSYITMLIARTMTLAGAGISCRRVSVRPSVCQPQVGVLLKRLNAGACRQRHTIAQGLTFSGAENLGKNSNGVTRNGGAKCRCGRFNAGPVAENLQLSTRKRCQLSSVAGVSHRASAFVCSTSRGSVSDSSYLAVM